METRRMLKKLSATCRAATQSENSFVLVKIAQSLDGKVATSTGESKWITNELSRKTGHELRGMVDAILVGSGTVLADDPKLTCRIPDATNPIRVILDTQAKTPKSAAVIQQAASNPGSTILVVDAELPSNKTDAFKELGVDILPCSMKNGKIELQVLLQALKERSLYSLLIEGGPTLIGSFFDEKLVNKVCLFIAPKLIGGLQARSSIEGQGAAQLDAQLDLINIATIHLNGDMLIVGDVCR